jgi:hypothetical protein
VFLEIELSSPPMSCVRNLRERSWQNIGVRAVNRNISETYRTNTQASRIATSRNAAKLRQRLARAAAAAAAAAADVGDARARSFRTPSDAWALERQLSSGPSL